MKLLGRIKRWHKNLVIKWEHETFLDDWYKKDYKKTLLKEQDNE